jgi:predicted NUDIX family NTP pyrophosphohydrolase
MFPLERNAHLELLTSRNDPGGDEAQVRYANSKCRSSALRRRPAGVEVFLVHMGGPIWARKDLAAWSIPKGVVGRQEDPLAAAIREFFEETGFQSRGEYEALGTIHQNSSKDLTVWALEGDCDPAQFKSNTFSMVWPPKSGQLQEFPEADRGAWFALPAARQKLVKGQRPALDRFIASQEAY